ncbi:predicted protein [Escherichia albertii]|nr:predicted protein [Escherichia albertii]
MCRPELIFLYSKSYPVFYKSYYVRQYTYGNNENMIVIIHFVNIFQISYIGICDFNRVFHHNGAHHDVENL